MPNFKNFIEWPTEEEAPLNFKKFRPVAKPLAKWRVPKASPVNVFMAQSLDHGLAFAATAACLFLAVSLFSGLTGPDFFVGLGPGFWVGVFGLMFLIGLVVRATGYALFGQSPGAHLMHVQLYLRHHSPVKQLGCYAWESFEGAIPGLWLLTTLLRLSEAPAGVSYVTKNL